MIAETGDKVRVNYHGQLEDGTLIDTTFGKKPVEFVIGEHKVIRGMEEAVVGMKAGDNKIVDIPPEKAFGHVREELIVPDVPKSELHHNIKPAEGMTLQWDLPTGPPLTVRITQVKEDVVSFDGNHLLAGETLTFEITMIDVDKS